MLPGIYQPMLLDAAGAGGLAIFVVGGFFVAILALILPAILGLIVVLIKSIIDRNKK